MQPYPKEISEANVVESLRQISRYRGEDITDRNNFPSIFMLGRKVGKVPSSSTDVVPTDRVGDFNYTPTALYFLADNAGTPVWIRFSSQPVITGNVSSDIPTGSAISLSTGVAANLTSISLGAGDWDVVAAAGFSGATTTQRIQLGISTVSATLPAAGFRQSLPNGPTANADVILAAPQTRINVSSTTPVYIVVESAFTVGSQVAYGQISARLRGSYQ